jgi:hypothetical protein
LKQSLLTFSLGSASESYNRKGSSDIADAPLDDAISISSTSVDLQRPHSSTPVHSNHPDTKPPSSDIRKRGGNWLKRKARVLDENDQPTSPEAASSSLSVQPLSPPSQLHSEKRKRKAREQALSESGDQSDDELIQHQLLNAAEDSSREPTPLLHSANKRQRRGSNDLAGFVVTDDEDSEESLAGSVCAGRSADIDVVKVSSSPTRSIARREKRSAWNKRTINPRATRKPETLALLSGIQIPNHIFPKSSYEGYTPPLEPAKERQVVKEFLVSTDLLP